jgi:hypothetical protein
MSKPSVKFITRKGFTTAVAPSAEERRARAFKSACIEARNLMAQGYAVRIHQLEKDDFRVFGRKNVTK